MINSSEEGKNQNPTMSGLPAHYEVQVPLGEGSYGAVFLASDLRTQKDVAIKVFRDIYREAFKWKRIMREVEILAKLQNQYHVSLLDAILDEGNNDLYIVMDYMQYDLQKFCKLPIFLDAGQIKLIMYQIFCGLEYLHSCQVIHRDIKPGNILINEDCSVRFCDYSLARSIAGLNATNFDFSIWLRQSSLNSTDEKLITESLSEIASKSGIFTSISELQSIIIEDKDYMKSVNQGSVEVHTMDLPPDTLDNDIETSSLPQIPQLECREIAENRNPDEENEEGYIPSHLPPSLPELSNLESLEDEGEVNEKDLDEFEHCKNHIDHRALSHNVNDMFNIHKSITKDHIEKLIHATNEEAKTHFGLLTKKLGQEYEMEKFERHLKAHKKGLKRNSLEFEKRMDPKKARELSNHIATRYYRPLEIILVERIYTTSVDIWGAGCIFAEVLNMMNENQPFPLRRSPLFPGRSCYPLSPDIMAIKQAKEIHTTSTDQLNLIFQVLGSPDYESLAFLSDQKAKDYINSFPKYEKQEMGELFPGADAQAIKLLQSTLQINPYMRITAKEALRHPYFGDVRDRNLEQVGEGPVVLFEDTVEINDKSDRKELTRQLFATLNLI